MNTLTNDAIKIRIEALKNSHAQNKNAITSTHLDDARALEELLSLRAQLAALRGQEPVAFRWRLSATADCGASDWTYLPVDRAGYFIDLVAEKDTSVEYGNVYAYPIPPITSPDDATPVPPAASQPEVRATGGLLSDDERPADSSSAPDKCPGIPAWVFAENVDPRQCYAAGWKARAAATANSPVIPDGYVMVPIEPTEAMMLHKSGCQHHAWNDPDCAMRQTRRLIWSHMLAAAPQSDQFRGVTKLVSAAVRDVIAERQRQVAAEGWTPEHDDEHVAFEMSFAAATYVLHIAQSYGGQPYKHVAPSEIWPWDLKWLKFAPGPRRSLVKAAALILAEIDRLDRAAPQSEGGEA
ncbi:hypothetical protein [Dickeya fangzhongdai]|uniref:hypothetical protein n=1 Tax=Dickeya fangzhongdai TaxID=1778540 RepID=UPI002B262B7E|nr:hypothetical protein [Dickeya fangzhongdai]WOX99948.1 hypothetical protein OGM22_20485 [Dickeya fangzhongdai]WOY04903.1 hypothetical protein OGM21_01940 [Dickeya fangzhongdai]